jgi:uncharacterized membrane protein
MVGLPGLGNAVSQAHSCSADGSVVVGQAWSPSGFQAFQWTASTGTVGLGDLTGGGFISGAEHVSPDGSVIVGFGVSAGGLEAFRWTAASGMVGLGDLPGGSFFSIANSCSASGQVVIGQSVSAASTPDAEAFRWTTAGMVPLGDFPTGPYKSTGYACSADGNIIVGEATTELGPAAFIWDAQYGMRGLQTVLITAGQPATLFGWKLQTATAISEDGTVIAGYGLDPQGLRQGWVARVPRACYPNCDASTTLPVLNVWDFNCFLNAFSAGTAYANCDGNTTAPTHTIADFLCFLNRFNSGCS